MSPIRRILGAALLVALACGALAGYSTGAAVAKGARPALTHTEYKLLTTTLAGVKKALFGKRLDLTLGYSSCRSDGSSTPLMRSERGSCHAEVAMFEQLEQVGVTVLRCDARYPTSTTTTTTPTTTTGTTTTGTTTAGTTTTTATTGVTTTTTTPTVDGVSNNALLAVACLNPAYQRVVHDIEVMSAAAVLNHERAVSRGFTGACLTVLAGTQKLIGDDRRFAAAAKRIAADLAVFTKIADGESPSKIPSKSQLVSDSLAFELTANSYTVDSTPRTRVSVCPHE